MSDWDLNIGDVIVAIKKGYDDDGVNSISTNKSYTIIDCDRLFGNFTIIDDYKREFYVTYSDMVEVTDNYESSTFITLKKHRELKLKSLGYVNTEEG